MKNLSKTLTLLLFLALSFSLSAQIAIGPKVGINMATQAGDALDDLDPKTLMGIQAGLAAEISINEMIAVQPELLYFQKGVKYDGTDIKGNSVETKGFLNYFEIPVLLKLKFGAEEGPKFFVTVGPSFGFGLNGKIKTDGADDEDVDFDDDMLKKFDLGLSGGLGVQIGAGPGDLFLDARYLLGFTTVDDSEADLDMKNRGAGFAIGYLFPIGGE